MLTHWNRFQQRPKGVGRTPPFAGGWSIDTACRDTAFITVAVGEKTKKKKTAGHLGETVLRIKGNPRAK